MGTCVCVCVHTRVCALSRVPLSVTPWTVACEAPPWDFPGKNTRLGCHFLLQGLFPTQGLNLLHWQADSLPLRSCFRILAIVNNEAIMVAQLVKNTPATQDTPGSIPGLGMVTHFRILAWRAPMDRSLAGKSSWGHKESDMTEPLSTGHIGSMYLF